MFGSVDFLGLFNRSMIKPEHNIMIAFEFGASHRNWLVSIVCKDSQRTGRVESDALD